MRKAICWWLTLLLLLASIPSSWAADPVTNSLSGKQALSSIAADDDFYVNQHVSGSTYSTKRASLSTLIKSLQLTNEARYGTKDFVIRPGTNNAVGIWLEGAGAADGSSAFYIKPVKDQANAPFRILDPNDLTSLGVLSLTPDYDLAGPYAGASFPKKYGLGFTWNILSNGNAGFQTISGLGTGITNANGYRLAGLNEVTNTATAVAGSSSNGLLSIIQAGVSTNSWTHYTTNIYIVSECDSNDANGTYTWAGGGGYTNANGLWGIELYDMGGGTINPYLTNDHGEYVFQQTVSDNALVPSWVTPWNATEVKYGTGDGIKSEYGTTDLVLAQQFQPFTPNFTNGLKGTWMDFGDKTTYNPGRDARGYYRGSLGFNSFVLGGSLNEVAGYSAQNFNCVQVTNRGVKLTIISSAFIDGYAANANYGILGSEFCTISNLNGIGSLVGSCYTRDRGNTAYAVVGASYTDIGKDTQGSVIMGGGFGMTDMPTNYFNAKNSFLFGAGCTNEGVNLVSLGQYNTQSNCNTVLTLGQGIRVFDATNEVYIGFTNTYLKITPTGITLITNGVEKTAF